MHILIMCMCVYLGIVVEKWMKLIVESDGSEEEKGVNNIDD